MEITFDQAKRDWTLAKRGLAFEDATLVFAGKTYEWPDVRQDYGEMRVITVGWLGRRMVIVVWTPRGNTRHVMSMRKANAREQAQYRERLE